MNTTDLVTDFYASHPAAICSCIKAMETTEEYSPSCPTNQITPIPPNSPSTFSACSSETQLSSPTHISLENLYQLPESQDRYSTPSISPLITPSCTSACARNTTALSTANRWHNIQTYLAQDSPHPLSSPLEQTMESPLSEYIQKATIYTYSLPVVDKVHAI